MEAADVISFKSQIDPDYIVTVIYPESDSYQIIRSLIEGIGGGIAALAIGKKLILVDGAELEKIDQHQFKAVQAHEICHGVLEHNLDNPEKEEIEADLAAIDLLIRINEIRASESLSRRLRIQRGLEYSESKLRGLLSGRSLELYTNYLLR